MRLLGQSYTFFFYDKISQVQKSTRIQGTKKYQKALKSIKAQAI